MSTTEVPTSPPTPENTPGGSQEPPHFDGKDRARRYEGYDVHDLLSVIDDLEGTRNWASLREKFWIALIFHLILFWFILYGPRYIFHQRVHVVNESALLQHPKQMTYLVTPDNIKPMKPKKPTNVISNKNHVAESPHPTLNKKTIQQLEAMERAGRPVPRTAPHPAERAAIQPAPKPVEQAKSAPPSQQPKPPAQPLPTNARNNTPAPPAAPKPNFNLNNGSPGQQLREMARAAAQPGQFGGAMGENAPSNHPGEQGAVDILSDTMGVNFGPYIERVIWDTKRAWYPIIPEVAQPPLNKQGRVTIRFKILPNGSVAPGSMMLVTPSGDVSLDKAAWAAITYAGYPPLPKHFKGPFLELQFTFLYNEPLNGN